MMRRPLQLASFVDSLQPRSACEQIELVVAGDFIDFLALTPYADFTPDPREAGAKLRAVIDHGSPYTPIFDALARFAAKGHRFTVLVGNHDVELGLPGTQTALAERLAACPHEVRFVDDGRAYRTGHALIEHGNAYDGANANDWDGLRHIRSAQSRGLTPERPLLVSAGSQLVHRVVNELKGRYPFLPLLQPEGEVLALLLVALEPRLMVDLPMLRQVLRARRLAEAPPQAGVRPMTARGAGQVGADPELAVAFPGIYEALVAPANGSIGGLGGWLRPWVVAERDSLSDLLRSGRPVPADRLAQLRVTIEKLLRTDRSDALDGPTGAYGASANKMLESSDVDAVVMGHTHLARCKEYDGGVYINAGTWIDRIRVPSSALHDESGEEFEAFLRVLLVPGAVPPLAPTFAELAISESGRVTRAEVRKWEGAG